MKKINYAFIYIIILITIIISEYEYINDPEKVINYINEKKLEKNELNKIVDYLTNIFNDAYAFNEISKHPPQPSNLNNYHNTVDISSSLNQLKNKIKNNEISEAYDFYREINIIFSQLKDSHIQFSWNLLELQKFYILAPVEFYLKEINNEPKIFVTCLEDEFQDRNVENVENVDINQVLNTCSDNKDKPVKLINDEDPFDFINNFGGNFLSTKNKHATFSFKLKNHNNLPLSDYPLSLNELQALKIEFESGETIDTKYFIGSDSIEIEEEERLRNLNKKNINNNLRTKINRKRKSKRKLYNNNINWNYETKGEDEDFFKCFEDTTNKINIYYITSFNPSKIDRYISVIKYCYELFDKNEYPIIVINDLNEGGLVSLSQLFLGILSPLMPINIYKGRIRITDTFKNTPEIKYYIETNLTSSENCLHTNYEVLTSERVNVKYDNNLEIDLTQIFFLNNISIHNEIENITKEMTNKRKPTDILVFTDGYTFSAGSLFMQYLQKNGGAIIASYIGNPKSNQKFDISQSPSPLFNSELLKIFSPENYIKLNEESYSKNDNNWEIQFPGIQSFYDSDDYKNPLEYEVILPDENSYIYENLNDDNYNRFIEKSKEIFNKYEEECSKNNKNLIKVDKDCNNKFGNKYTHGGYECGDDGKWNKNICVPSYCDPGYFFNQKKKKCVKDICSSIPIIDNDVDNAEKINLDNNYFRLNIKINIIILFVYIFI